MSTTSYMPSADIVEKLTYLVAEKKKVEKLNLKPVKVAPLVLGERLGRNDPCECGSGKKYKKCCLLNSA